MPIFPQPDQPCLCNSGQAYKQCCYPVVQQVTRQLEQECPDIMLLPDGPHWLSWAGFMAGLGPSRLADRVEEIAEAQNRILDTLMADTPDDYDQLRGHVWSIITANRYLRFHKVDRRRVKDSMNEKVTPEFRGSVFWYLYSLHRLFIDDPTRLAACALANRELGRLESPARSLFWPMVLKATDEDLYRSFVDWYFETYPKYPGIRWALKAIMRERIQLDLPADLIAHGVRQVKKTAPEELKKTMQLRGATKKRGETTEDVLLAHGMDGQALSQLGDCALEAFEVEGEEFTEVFTERLATWFYEAGFPRSIWSLDVLEQVHRLLSLLRGPKDEKRQKIAAMLYMDAVTRAATGNGVL